MVYVDNMNAPFGDMIMCHMIADSSEELLAMADKIGVKRKWLQYPSTKREHFDICLSKKKLAIKAGAQEISMMELGYMIGQIDGPDQKLEPENMSIGQLVMRFDDNPDHKGSDQITVKVGELKYLIPHYCLVAALWGMPDNFYPCDKYEWADHPLYFTSIEMVKEAITANPAKFKAFILYR